LKTKSKRNEEKAIFYDIFIKPKENKIKEIRNKRNEQKGIKDSDIRLNPNGTKIIEKPKLFISNKATEMTKIKVNESSSSWMEENNATNLDNLIIQGKSYKMKEIIQINHNNWLESIKKNLDEHFGERKGEYAQILLKYLSDKFIPIDDLSLSKKNFFNQLIQIRPPEGINAVAASPLIETNKGWAPSIPSLQMSKMKTNLNDLMMRAKGGIQSGDIPKEAHMAFYLGIMNEEEKRYEEALKFYKKYFLSAKLFKYYGL
jgi:hypothetical protein